MTMTASGRAAGAVAARAEYVGAVAAARAEYASNAVAQAQAEAGPYAGEERGRGAIHGGGYANSDNRGGYASAPPPHAAPSRPSFDGRGNNRQAASKDKRGVLRRFLNRLRD